MIAAQAICLLGGGWIAGVFTVLALLRDPPEDGERKGKRSVPPW